MSRNGFVVSAVAAAVVAIGAAVVYWPNGSPPSAQAPAPLAQAPASASRIEGHLSIAPGSEPIPEGSTVVVYAYAIDGPQAPLAVLRRPASALPFDFSLDDSSAEKAEHRLSNAQQVVIGARLGVGGEALSQVGDWLAGSQKVVPGAQGVQLVLQPPPR